ncbi:MAG: ectoine synthase [Gammaproteobacteria bacterium]|nr:MAG: ectoine synthase [Gammaproteobacteria bacterium]
MIIRKLADAIDTKRLVRSEGWESIRLLLKEDGMGFSFHITTIFAGAHLPMHYQHHLESVFCLSGDGEIEDRESGAIHPIEAGTLYALDQHDKHTLRANTDMVMACVFNPPVTGQEVHDASGAYPADSSGE